MVKRVTHRSSHHVTGWLVFADGRSAIDSWSPVPLHGGAVAAIFRETGVDRPKLSWRLTSFLGCSPDMRADAPTLPKFGEVGLRGVPLMSVGLGAVIRPEQVGAPS